MKFYPLFLLIIITLFSCQEEKNSYSKSHNIKVVEAKGYVEPKDSMAEPEVVLVDESKLKKVPAGKPTVIATNTYIHPAGIPTVIMAGKPRICTPGQDTFLLPKIVPAIDSPFVAGVPETVIAKDMVTKDQNPANVKTFGILQGLVNKHINCLVEDKLGNLWFGTNGGVTKYDGKYFTHFTNKEGLARNIVSSILEDKSGNLWFGTNGGGVSKYDGKSFTTFNKKKGLATKFISSILEDKSGNLWFGSYGGVSMYDGKSFTHFTDKEGLSNAYVSSMLEDKSGNLWFGTDGGGVCRYDGKSFTIFTEKEGLSNNFVNAILEDKSGILWFGTLNGGVSKYDGESFTRFTENEGLISNSVYSILEDKSGNLWFGTFNGGLSKYDGKYFVNYTDEDGLVNGNVSCLLEDKSGNIWFSSEDEGVSKYDGKSFKTYTDKEGLVNNKVSGIIKDKFENLWFGTNWGLSKYDGKSFTNIPYFEGLGNYTVLSILEDKSGNIWLSNYDGVTKYDGKSFTTFTDKEGLSNNFVLSMLEDKSGNLWFGTNGGGVSKYDGKSFTHFTDKEGLSNNFVLSLLEDKSGNLWFGTYGAVSKYDGKSFVHYTAKDGLSNFEVTSIIEDKSGNLWFGSDGGGVSKYNGKFITTFTQKEGLTNNYVTSILEDKSGNLWFGLRDGGVSKLSSSEITIIDQKIRTNSLSENDVIFKNYTYTDGFLGLGVNSGKTMLESNDGTIWIGAQDRLTAMHRENLPPDTMAPNIQLTTIELFNENIIWQNLENKKDSTLTLGNGVNVSNFNFDGLTKWYNLPENLSLAYDNNYLTFNFIGITMNQPKNVKYQYILEGLDENWSAITSKNEAPYGNLPHGTYTFKVKAMNSEGYWSKPFEYKFNIRPPFWKTWWFRTLIGLIIISSSWYYIKSREKKLVARQQQLEKTVEERTAEVVLEKEESDKQRKVAEEQKHIAEEQKHLVEEKHKEITDSINYAERIQRSFLASKEMLDENLKEHFVFFQPKDVVSGDFYWATTLREPQGSGVNNKFALVTADSTGHGVPGAIMSLLNITSLETALKDGYKEPSDILNATRKTIIERLKKDGSEHGGKDGMDASLICFDFENNKFTYAAANNPIWIVRNNELLELKPDKMPVGKHDRDFESFTQHDFDFQKGDVVYTLTDGMPDQFGGPKGKKFMYKQLKELLVSIAHEPMGKQKQILTNSLNTWKGDLEQVDDVCLIGVRV